MPGRMDAPDDMARPRWCSDCEQWHESDDRISYDGPVKCRSYTKCPLRGSKDQTRGPQMYISDPLDSLESSDSLGGDVPSGQSSLGQFSD